MFLPLKRGGGKEGMGREERGWKGKGREKGREGARGILLQGLKGDRRPRVPETEQRVGYRLGLNH